MNGVSRTVKFPGNIPIKSTQEISFRFKLEDNLFKILLLRSISSNIRSEIKFYGGAVKRDFRT